MGEWIDIKVKLPKTESLVLVQTDEPEIYLARLGGHKDTFWVEWSSIRFSIKDAMYWQPIVPSTPAQSGETDKQAP